MGNYIRTDSPLNVFLITFLARNIGRPTFYLWHWTRLARWTNVDLFHALAWYRVAHSHVKRYNFAQQKGQMSKTCLYVDSTGIILVVMDDIGLYHDFWEKLIQGRINIWKQIQDYCTIFHMNCHLVPECFFLCINKAAQPIKTFQP